MNKREIKSRLKTLDKVEARWRKLRMNADDGSESCELCAESRGPGGVFPNKTGCCCDCTYVLVYETVCTNKGGPLDRARSRNSIRPIMDAIRKMRKYLKAQQ
jgi:hypothetical protein